MPRKLECVPPRPRELPQQASLPLFSTLHGAQPCTGHTISTRGRGGDTAHAVASSHTPRSGTLYVVALKTALRVPWKCGVTGAEWRDLTVRAIAGDRCLMEFRARELPRLFHHCLPLRCLVFPPCPPHLYTLALLLSFGAEKGNKPCPLLPWKS